VNQNKGGNGFGNITYFESVASSSTPYINDDLSQWDLILGFDAQQAFAAGGEIAIKNSTNTIIDSMASQTGGAGTGIFLTISKKLLIPPGGSVVVSNTVNFQAISGSLEDVMKYI
jgi:hypothetical protein